MLISFYVNQITSFTKETFKSFIPDENPNTNAFEAIEEDVDYDNDDNDDNDYSVISDSSDEVIGDGSSEEDISEEDIYAPIFGRWKFHTHVPILRRLWKRQIYLDIDDDDDDDYLFDEGFETDYPLHRFLSSSPLIPSRLRVLRSRRKGNISSDSLPLAQISERIEELPQTRDQDQNRDQDNAHTRSTETGELDRESSSTSGLERHASGLGAAFPEPLRRLFIKRRRRPDVES
jgi:hypothetical protein